MISTTGLSAESVRLLQVRGWTEQDIGNFSDVLNEARQELGGGQSAHQVLSDMSDGELALIQRGAGLADPVNVNNVSDEGAANLLAQPDKSDAVDLNNDGIVEVGKARTVVFPPVNAPANVKVAWGEATADMSDGDKLMMQLTMHVAVYGIQIDGVSESQALPPEQQWSAHGITDLMEKLRSALQFAVNLDGWDSDKLQQQAFYDRFEQALATA